MQARQIKLAHLVLGALLAYIPLHLLEEGLGGFPAWAEQYWHIPNYAVGKWLLHNVFFIAALLIGYVFYRLDQERFLSAGLGIILWGLMNTLNHVGCSIAFGAIEPVLFTSFIFALIAVLAVRQLRTQGRLSLGLVGLALAWNVLYWGIPIASFILVPGLG
jgi:hypothetical protein